MIDQQHATHRVAIDLRRWLSCSAAHPARLRASHRRQRRHALPPADRPPAPRDRRPRPGRRRRHRRPRRLQVPHGRRPRRQSPHSPIIGHGALHGNFEYAVELFPFWQSYTPTFQRAMLHQPPGTPPSPAPPFYTVGGTFTGISITPVIFRWNFAGTQRSPSGARPPAGPLDQPQVPSLRRPTLQLTKRRPQRRRQRLELHPAGRRRRPLLRQPPPLHRLRRQRRPHLQRLPRRPKPRRQCQRPIFPWLHLVEVKLLN